MFPHKPKRFERWSCRGWGSSGGGHWGRTSGKVIPVSFRSDPPFSIPIRKAGCVVESGGGCNKNAPLSSFNANANSFNTLEFACPELLLD
jgi:hypothetical protein